MKAKIEQLISQWDKELRIAQQQVVLSIKKHKYGEANEYQIKAVWIENCILELKEIL